MNTILERPRTTSQPQLPSPSIREVCLVGDRKRRYVHIPQELGAGQDRAKTRKT